MTMFKRLAALMMALALLATVCGCGVEAPEISIEKVDNGTTASSDTASTDPAVTDPAATDSADATPPTPTDAPEQPVSAGKMTLSSVMSEMGSRIRWSALKVYDHTKSDATHATFPVSDNEGNECTLNVTFDEAADAVTAATLSYGDVSVDVLTDDTMVIRTIMLAMDED